MIEAIFMKPGVYITAYSTNPSHQSLCSLSAHLLSLIGKGSVKYFLNFVARQRLGKHVPVERNTRNDRRIVELVYAGLVLSKESVELSVYPLNPMHGVISGLPCPRGERNTGTCPSKWGGPKFETLRYGHERRGTQTREGLRW
jgi:hypothetical protein